MISKRYSTSFTYCVNNCLSLEFRLEDAMLCSKLGNENSDASHIKCSRGLHLARGQQVPRPEAS